MPKVSVIVPFYNCALYLRDCVNSILAQSFRDIEVILVDDGSTDGSAEIADGYAVSDGRVRVIHQPNGGQSSARNAGLEAASGDYIYISDSDDAVHPRMLETVLDRYGEGWDLVCFCFRMTPPPAVPDDRLMPVMEKEKTVILDTDEQRFDFLLGDFRRRAIRWEVWNRVFRRDIIERWHVRFPGDRRAYPEDLFFNYCYVAHCSRILMLPDMLYEYRLRPGSVSDRLSRDLMIRTSNLITLALEEHYRASADCGYLADHFPPFYYLLHKGALRRLRRYQWKQGLTVRDARDILREQIGDGDGFIRRMSEAYDDPAVRASYREDRDRFLQFTERLYTAELLDLPASGFRRALRRGTLRLIRRFFSKRV